VMIETNGSCDISVCFFFPFQGVIQGLENDFNVEEEAPVFQIKDIIFYPVYNMGLAVHFPSEPTDLGQTCYARLNEMAHHKLIDTFGIHMGVAYHVRARSHSAHFSLEHVYELGKFINAS